MAKDELKQKGELNLDESIISKRTEKAIEKGHLDENEEEKQQIVVG